MGTIETVETQKVAAIERWRSYGRDYLAQKCPQVSLRDFREEVIAILRREVTNCYMESLGLSKFRPDGDDEEQNQSDIGKKYLVDAGTINKWINKSESGELNDMMFSRACVIAAAEDVVFPRGQRAAVIGTSKTLTYIAQRIGFSNADSFDYESVLWLHFIVRSDEWERVQRKKSLELSKRKREQAAKSIWESVVHWYPLAQVKEPQEIESLSGNGRLRTQAVFEAVINHEWFS